MHWSFTLVLPKIKWDQVRSEQYLLLATQQSNHPASAITSSLTLLSDGTNEFPRGFRSDRRLTL